MTPHALRLGHPPRVAQCRSMQRDDDVMVLIEIPGGSRNKYELD